ncbi:MAG: RICIN domain-containing protein, partial [Pseudomonadota bacterium]
MKLTARFTALLASLLFATQALGNITQMSEAGQFKTAGNNCLDISGSKGPFQANGKVHIWRCGRSLNQQWWLTGNRLLNAGGRCLTAKGGTISSTNCGGDASQQWRLN